MSYPNPIDAAQALARCLNPGPNVDIHYGSLASGRTAAGCDRDILRIETGRTMPRRGEAMQVLNRTPGPGCKNDLVQELVVTFMTCFQTNVGKSALPLSELTVMGTNIVLSWWQAMFNVACCSPENANFRFTGREDTDPEGGYAGWRMTFEVDIAFCAPCSQ